MAAEKSLEKALLIVTSVYISVFNERAPWKLRNDGLRLTMVCLQCALGHDKNLADLDYIPANRTTQLPSFIASEFTPNYVHVTAEPPLRRASS